MDHLRRVLLERLKELEQLLVTSESIHEKHMIELEIKQVNKSLSVLYSEDITK